MNLKRISCEVGIEFLNFWDNGLPSITIVYTNMEMYVRSRDSSVGIGMSYGLDDRGSNLSKGKRFFSTALNGIDEQFEKGVLIKRCTIFLAFI
jgi:hypothetical protein